MSRRWYNPSFKDAWAFNNCIQMFPGSLVNTVINKQAIKPFSDKEAAASFD
ncbi:lemA protein, putative [Pseudomonas chlororaphis]|nr:lemA protein, putative [Pseudomonas chlororaphis]